MTTKLLAVDDSKTLRKVLEITFAGEDFQTELAGSADEALQKLRANRPAVAVIDTALAGASGYDLCQQIKGEAPDVVVVLLSSKHRPYDQSRGAQVGADDYIDKPFDTQKLIDKVNGLLAGEGARPRAPAAQAPHAPPPQAPPPHAAPPHAAPSQAQQPSAAPARQAPRPAVSAVPQRPVSQPQAPSAQPSRPASPSPAVSARPVAPAPSFGAGGAGGGARPPAQPAAPAAAPPRVAAAVAGAGADLTGQLQELGLDANQVQGVLALSREVLERVVWEVVPVLAETLIKEEIARLTAE